VWVFELKLFLERESKDFFFLNWEAFYTTFHALEAQKWLEFALQQVSIFLAIFVLA